MKFKIIIAIISVLIVSGGIFYYLRYYQRDTKVSKTMTLEKSSDYTKSANNFQTKKKLLIFQKKDDSNEISSYDLALKERKVIFSDIDSEQKIERIGNYAYFSNEVLIFVGTSTGKLAVVGADGNMADISDNILKPEVMAISPDGQLVAYVLPSVEKDGSYNLYQISRKGINKRQLLANTPPINEISYDKNSEKIGILQTLIDKKSQISVLNTNSLQLDKIYTTDNPISTIFYHQNGRIIFSEGSDAKMTAGTIYSIFDNGADKKKILQTKKGFPYSAATSSDFLDTAYVLKEFTDKVDGNLPGEATIVAVGDNMENKIGTGNIILGWLP